jgi:signal transduction histidine kinase
MNVQFLGIPTRLFRTLVFLGALLLLVNFTVLYLIRTARRHLDDELGLRFIGTAHTAAVLVQPRLVDLLIPAPGDSLSDDFTLQMDRADAENEVRAEWVKLAEGAGVGNILLLDPNRRVVLGLRDALYRGSERTSLDEAALQQALLGYAASTALYRVGGEYLKSAYAPVVRFGGEVAGVVVVEGGSGAFRPLDQITVSFAAAAVLASALLVVVALMFLRTFGRLALAEERMRHTDIQASVGQLAAAVAHEIRNPLTVLRGVSARLRKFERLREEERGELLRMVDEEVDRMGHVVQNFLDLSRRSNNEPEIFPLRPVLERSLEILRVELSRSEIETSLQWEGEDDLRIRGQPQVMHHVFLNLALNARNFMPEGGRLTIRVQPRKSQVRILFEDTGPGVPPAVRSRIFDAGFTTRPEGTGLGLAFVDRVVTEHGGSVTVDAAPGGGASFQITLPLASA